MYAVILQPENESGTGERWRPLSATGSEEYQLPSEDEAAIAAHSRYIVIPMSRHKVIVQNAGVRSHATFLVPRSEFLK